MRQDCIDNGFNANDVWHFVEDIGKECPNCNIPLSRYRREGPEESEWAEHGIWCDECEVEFEYYPVHKTTGVSRWHGDLLKTYEEIRIEKNLNGGDDDVIL